LAASAVMGLISYEIIQLNFAPLFISHKQEAPKHNKTMPDL